MSTRNTLADRTTRPYERSRRDGDESQPRIRTPRKVEISVRDGQKKTRTPNVKNGDKYQNLFGRTSTLTGAFASTGPALEGNHNNNTGVRDVRAGRTPPKQNSYREGKLPAVSPRSNASSPRHGDLFGAHRRFGDGDDISFEDDPYTMAPDPLSPSPSSRQRYNVASRYVPDPTLDFYDIAMEPPRRRRGSQHASDQERLRRATERGPVLSKAMVGSKRRTSAERAPAQKKEQEVEEIQPKAGFEPSLNVPSGWGQKSKFTKGLIDRMNREDTGNDSEEEPVQAPGEWENDLDFTSRSFHVSNSPPLQPRRTSNSPPAFRTKVSPRMLDRRIEPPEQLQASHPREKNLFPDTPVAAHNEAGGDRPKFTKRDDSRELLRKLRRSESPGVTDTPEPKPVDDTISNMKTPVVMGAWIDTPAPERTTAHKTVSAKERPSPIAESVEEPDNVEPHKPEESKHESAEPPPERTKPKIRTIRRPRPELKKPDLPKSGLEAFIKEAKSGCDKSFLVGENTIESLQEIFLNDNPNFSEFKEFDPKDLKLSESDKTSSDEDDPALPLDSPNEAAIDRMNAKLQSLTQNIKEVCDGLSGLETQVTKDIAALSPLRKRRGKNSHSCRGKGEPCDACGLSGDGRLYFALPLPRLWHRRPDTNRLRPTFLSWFLIATIAWWFLECFMCELYCEPLYLDTSRPFSLPDPDAPETPFVIPTMLWRWSGLESLAPAFAPLWTLLVAFYRFWAHLLGFWDGYAPDPPEIPIHLRGGGPLMDDVTASRMLARNGYVGRPDPPVDFGRPPPKYTPAPQQQPPPIYWGQGDADEGLSMEEDEIL